MTGQDGFWSAQEIRTQAEQCRDQLTVWDILAVTRECDACGAVPGEACRPGCVGAAVHVEHGGML